jgi:hypothetical protein
MQAMRRLLDGEGDPEGFNERLIDDLDTADAYRDWSETYDEPNPLIVAEERALRTLLVEVPAGRAIDVASGTGRIADDLYLNLEAAIGGLPFALLWSFERPA